MIELTKDDKFLIDSFGVATREETIIATEITENCIRLAKLKLQSSVSKGCIVFTQTIIVVQMSRQKLLYKEGK